ncbi:hypothetical protein GGR57DRAFT_499276 [Xylariaceae sp. FL1272]|nr:hypothetical protein GGR57DRAFT_499276 [Xylariaceae sp. FL1272]
MPDQDPAEAGSDESLLDRLNALKPSSISLTSEPASEFSPASTIERAKPPSREDALKDRLKNLRTQEADSISQTSRSPQALGTDPKKSSQPRLAEKSRFSTESEQPRTTACSQPAQLSEDPDPLLETDDETLEELLADLRSDESWLDEVAAEETEHQRVTALLNELGKASSSKVDPEGQAKDDGEDGSDDDSDGEVMTRETNAVLSKAMDEAEWENSNKPSSPALQPTNAATVTANKTKSQTSSDNPPRSQDKQLTSSIDPFNLPTVPTELQEQPDLPTQSQSDTDFAASIASRMAALKLSGPHTLPSAPTAEVDSLGLPIAPTFAPSDRPLPGIAKRTGLTDDDEKTWCVVCLADGAVRCLGCDEGDNIYCSRCWKDMHIGPSAGFDERGHSFETFVSRPR